MAEKSLYFDECGFTGSDLLNPEQPHFCVGTSIIDNEAALEILKCSFPNFAGAEFGFGAIWKRPRNRRGLKIFAELLGARSDQVFIYWVDKKFCVLTKLVDSLVEPPAHAAGFDFYKNGYAPKYCNMWFHGIQIFGTPELYDSTVRVYQGFSRDPTPENLRKLQTTLHIMAKSVPVELKPFYAAAALGADVFLEFHDPEIHRGSSEIQFTTVLQCVAHWRNLLDDDFVVCHDASSNFFRNHDMWAQVTSPNVPAQVHDTANGPPNRFPLRVLRTISVNSMDCPAVQLCDVLAGLAARVFRNDSADPDLEFIHQVLHAGFENIGYNGIRPEVTFPEGGPSDLIGPDAVDQMLSIMFPGQKSHSGGGS